MRHTLAFLFCISVVSASAQNGSGSYKTGTTTISWSINEHHALIWNGQPYVPYGLRLSGSKESILAASALGITDVIVDLPANGMGWSDAISTLESRSMRYLIAIDSLAPAPSGYSIEPQSYRIDRITEKRSVDLTIPGAESALVVLALKRDSSVSMSKRVIPKEGRLHLDVDVQNGLEHVLLIYPEATSIGLADSWEMMDAHRDTLLSALKRSNPGPNFRGIVNPLGNMIPQTSERLFVPQSARFQVEFAAFLETKYRNIQTVQRAWSMAVSNIESFSNLAKLVPLWSGAKGLSLLWDPSTNALLNCESKRSAIWNDIRAVISTAEARRFKRLVAGVKKVCDVPVIQEWNGWLPTYEQSNPEVDGLGAKTEGASFTSISEAAGRCASSVFRWNRPGWLLATRIALDGDEGTGNITAIADDLSTLGIRAQFFRTDSSATRTQIAQESARRGSDTALSRFSPGRLFFPENALNPAHIQRLPNNVIWLPTPDPGNRIDFGSKFIGYRLVSPLGQTTAIWSTVGPQRVRLMVATPDKLKFYCPWLDPEPRLSKGKLDVTIGDFPVIISGSDEIPVPQVAVDELLLRLVAIETSAEKSRIDVSEDLYLFRNAYAGFDRNPGGSYSEMVTAYSKANARLARFMWVEAENFKETTFSEPVAIPSCSGGSALFLRTVLSDAVSDYFAEYSFMSRSNEELEVWVAARIPRENRGDVNLIVGSQLLKVTGEPISHYGNGFGWYKLGTTRLGGAISRIQVRVFPRPGTDLAIDSILFYPGKFEPRGVSQPDAVKPTPPEKG